MLIGLHKDNTLDILHKSTFKFHLTGSRYFGTAHNGSDTDFFVQDSPEVRKFLEENGFKTIPGKYRDTQTTDVFKRESIDIQVVKDYSLKLKAQELILFMCANKHFKWPYKNERCKLWNCAFYIASGFRVLPPR